MMMNPTLVDIVRDISSKFPCGLKHKDFVLKVLETGYKHKGQEGVSAAVYQTIKQLMVDGLMVRCETEDGIRSYHPNSPRKWQVA
jgi:hypothetical protein